MTGDEEEEEETQLPPKKNRKLVASKEEVATNYFVKGMCMQDAVMSHCITFCL